jgi:hypothetical protein
MPSLTLPVSSRATIIVGHHAGVAPLTILNLVVVDGTDLRALSSEKIAQALSMIASELSGRRARSGTTPMFDMTLLGSSELLAKIADALALRSEEGEIVIDAEGMATSELFSSPPSMPSCAAPVSSVARR